MTWIQITHRNVNQILRPRPASVRLPVFVPRPKPTTKPLAAARPDAPAFTSLGLAELVLQGVSAAGYTEPTPIQARAIPPVLRGGDVLGSAQTGTGKTAAFMLPILSRLGKHRPGQGPRALILEPTRELALQVEENARIYGKFTDLRATAVFGGVGYGKQREDLRRAWTCSSPPPAGCKISLTNGTCGSTAWNPRARRGGPDARHGLPARCA